MRGEYFAAWRFALLVIVGQACVSFATGEASGEEMEALEVAEAGGDFPTQEMRLKTDAMEAAYLAKQKIVAEFKEKKWQQKVLQVKVNNIADAEVKKRNARKAEAMKRIDKLQARRFQAMTANLDLKGEEDRVEATLRQGSLLHERSKKVAYSLNVAVKKTEQLKNGEGIEAFSDRSQVGAMEAKLRIAEAHADGSIKGLTKWQRKDTDSALLHASVETAVGTPTEMNVDLAKDQLHDTARSIHEKEWKRIDELKEKYKAKAAGEAQEKEDAAAEVKTKTEVGQKSEAEMAGKQKEGMSTHIELPHKQRLENNQKKATQHLIDHWSAHEQRVSDELGVKGNMKTEHMMAKEKQAIETKAAQEKIFKAECIKTEATKVAALELRGKKIGAFEAFRQGLVDVHEVLQNHVIIPAELLSDERDLGESSTHGIRSKKSAEHSRQLLGSIDVFGDEKTKKDTIKAQEATAKQEIKAKEAADKATHGAALAGTAMEHKQKNDAANKAAADEKAAADALHAAAERAQKHTESKEQERILKAKVKKSEKDAHFAEDEMQEANVKAAEADTANRKCEGQMFRRRRTCACDDVREREEALEEDELVLGEDSNTANSGDGNVQEWVRRRYANSPVSATGGTPDAVRIPTSLCPCCPILKAGETKSAACRLADDKANAGKSEELGDRAPDRSELQRQSPTAFVPTTSNLPKFSYNAYKTKMKNAVKTGDYVTAGMMQEELRKFHTPEKVNRVSVLSSVEVPQMKTPEVIMPDVAKMHKKAQSIVAGEMTGDEDDSSGGAFDQFHSIKMSPDEADLGESVSMSQHGMD